MELSIVKPSKVHIVFTELRLKCDLATFPEKALDRGIEWEARLGFKSVLSTTNLASFF